VSKEKGTATVSMEKHISLQELQKGLGGVESRYKIKPLDHHEATEKMKGWFETYKPVLLIFIYILAVSLLIQSQQGSFHLMEWMHHFMAGFFLIFSFFKMLNLKGFAESYSMYDIVARKFPAWGYIYAFTELVLGIAFLIHLTPLITYSVTLVVMSVSIVGVLKTVLDKKRIQCACLGDVFKLPMSTVTIIEDGLMIAMSAFMIYQVL
nr:heavy-metal-associated domain-containing protein [Saprospiraceae bacterium]